MRPEGLLAPECRQGSVLTLSEREAAHHPLDDTTDSAVTESHHTRCVGSLKRLCPGDVVRRRHLSSKEDAPPRSGEDVKPLESPHDPP